MIHQDKNANISYLPHTADIRMRVTAPDLEDLYVKAVEGMNGILKEDWSNAEENFEKTIEIRKALNMPYRLGDALKEFGHMYLDKGDNISAKIHLEKALNIFTTLENNKILSEIRQILGDIENG